MDGLFDLARQMADDVWPGRQLSEEAHMRDDEPTTDREMPLAAWKTWHRPHGVLMTAKSAAPGMVWSICPCGERLATVDAPKS